MADTGRIYAVLTGDLIKSSRLAVPESQGAMESLQKLAAEFAAVHSNALVGGLDVFRGDSWQLLLKQPTLALRAAVFLRAGLKMQSDARKKYDTRISIGVGRVEFVDETRISVSRGPAFTLSGEGLDTMEGTSLAFAAGDKQRPVLPWLTHGVIPLLDCVTGDWTPTVSRAVYGALKGWTQEESAERWPADKKTGKPLSRQAVGDSLVRGHWGVVEGVLTWFEQNNPQALELA